MAWNQVCVRVCVCVCVCVCEGVCLCLCQLAKRGYGKGVAYYKKAHNFKKDSRTCTRFGGKVGHELRTAALPIQSNWQRRGVAVGVSCYKEGITLKQIHVPWPNCTELHTHFHWLLLAPPLHFSPTPFHNSVRADRRGR